MTDFGLITMAFVLGFGHSFEADHLAAVSNLISRKKNALQSLKEGMFWGIGHTTTILIIGIIILVLKYSIPNTIFSNLEGMVGIMLISLGLFRVYRLFSETNQSNTISSHKLAFGVGLIHGLAGSGAVVALAISKTSSIAIGLYYLILFGLGSIVGMFSVSYFLGKLIHLKSFESFNLSLFFSYFSAFFCIIFGVWVVYENFFQGHI